MILSLKWIPGDVLGSKGGRLDIALTTHRTARVLRSSCTDVKKLFLERRMQHNFLPGKGDWKRLWGDPCAVDGVPATNYLIK